MIDKSEQTEKNYNLQRFLEAQEHTYSYALEEIKRGRKESHWMWFIFPQLGSLGRSDMAQYYGIENIKEARAYINHSVLGARLREISQALLELDTDNPAQVMGYIDSLKLRSCMTLFSKATDDNDVFLRVLKKYFGGIADSKTLIEIL